MSDAELIEGLREEARWMHGASLRHGSADAGISGNLADAAADRLEALTAALAERDARIAALEAGLRPFMPSWSDPGPITSDRSHLLLSATVGDVRRARALLDGGKP